MNDTPETDGEWNRLACQDHPEFERNLADFARKLERERDELRAKYAMHHAEAERMTAASRLPPPETESPASIVVSDACSAERWVIVRTRAEFLYMREWIWMSGQKQPLLARPTEYPIVLIVGGSGSPGWSDSMDRAANYVSFADFISQNEKAQTWEPKKSQSLNSARHESTL